MNIEIDDDYLDHLVGEAIVTTYFTLKADLKKAKKNPSAYHEEDIEYWTELIPALELVGGWYVFNFKKKAKIK